jgi:hypothetical protein
MPSGTHVEHVSVDYVPDPGMKVGPCDDPKCNDVCVITNCDDNVEYKLVQKTRTC